jgi:hypothetical protein
MCFLWGTKWIYILLVRRNSVFKGLTTIIVPCAGFCCISGGSQFLPASRLLTDDMFLINWRWRQGFILHGTCIFNFVPILCNLRSVATHWVMFTAATLGGLNAFCLQLLNGLRNAECLVLHEADAHLYSIRDTNHSNTCVLIRVTKFH